MTSAEFRALLDLWMVCDPFPGGVDDTAFEALLTREAFARGYITIPDAYDCHCADSAEPDRPAAPAGQPAGTLCPADTLVLRTHAGEADDGEHRYELSVSATSSPLVRSEQTGRFWAIGWAELIHLARAAGIDNQEASR